jgi:hypothetical protein
MGGNGVGLDSGGGSRGASFGGLGMRAIFSPFGLVHPKHDAQLRPRGGFGWCILLASRFRPPLQACFDQQTERFPAWTVLPMLNVTVLD